MAIYKITDSEYEKYIRLVMRRDQLRKEAAILEQDYLHEFGEEIYSLFETKVACIELKKKIHYCQAQVNSGKSVQTEEMKKIIEMEMQQYYQDLKQMMHDLEMVKERKIVPTHVALHAKRLYRDIAKMIHPDILPKSVEDEILEELWHRAVRAYHRSDEDELSEIKILAIHRMEELGMDVEAQIEIDDIDQRVKDLEEEIETIINTDPYQFRELFMQEELIEERHEEILDEIERYQKYKIELEEMLDLFLNGGDVRILWNKD